ncbi:MAG: ABC transporter permease subunit [Treponema sp.]|jgi:putative aldouronate transport system permease protein|nr:ABC transporter permease subunit [Treponema sp.]
MKKARSGLKKKYDTTTLQVMLLPAVVLIIIYNYIPMFGLLMAFQDYIPTLGVFGSPWVGLRNFINVFTMIEFSRALRNTVFLAACRIVLHIVVPVFFALLLNEVKKRWVQRTIQTLIYLPHFVSWILMAGILKDLLSPRYGIINTVLTNMGFESIFFLGNNTTFPWVVIVSDIWKEFGYGSIIYLAALMGIDPTLYEVAYMDGANRWKQTIHITIPGIAPIVVLMTTLSIGGILSANFDQIFNLYAPVVYETGDVLDTIIYRMGLLSVQYSAATALGMARSVVGLVLILISYRIAYKTTGYRVL